MIKQQTSEGYSYIRQQYGKSDRRRKSLPQMPKGQQYQPQVKMATGHHCSLKMKRMNTEKIHTANGPSPYRSGSGVNTGIIKEVDFAEFQETRKKFMKTDTGFAF